MDLKVQKNALLLGKALINRKVSVQPFVPFVSQKPVFDENIHSDPYFKVSDESLAGMDAARLHDFIKELIVDDSTKLHTLIVIRDKQIICSLALFPYRLEYWNYTFSMCKSVTSLAIGMLIDEGKLQLDTPLIDYFGKYVNTIDRLKYKNLTVRHLLTMSTGVAFNEIGSVTVSEWTKGFFTSNLKFDAGTKFDYNSMNTYILSVLVTMITGTSLQDFFQERLWKPLGINQVAWDCSPEGIEKGGWGLYLSPIDMAKIGQLYLNRGSWNGKQIISAEWIDEATKVQIQTHKSHGDYDYGYHLWVARSGDNYLLNGMFGQNVVIIPKRNMIFVTTAGNSDSFQTNNYFKIVARYFGDQAIATPTAEQNGPGALAALLEDLQAFPALPSHPLSGWKRFLQFFHKAPATALPTECAQIIDRIYHFDIDDCRGVGFVPKFIQGFLNNYGKGLDTISFRIAADQLHMLIKENDVAFDVVIGFTSAVYQTINFHGDNYTIAAWGSFARDEDERLVLKLSFAYLEYADTRYIRIYFEGDQALFRFKENPGIHYFRDNLAILAMNNRETRIIDLLKGRLDSDFVQYMIKMAIEPELIATIGSRKGE